MKSKTIILSIHPCYIEKIFSGEKLYILCKFALSNILMIDFDSNEKECLSFGW